MFTIPAQRQLPHLVVASPRDEQELRALVRTALARTRGNQTRAAELLGLSRFGLQKMIRRLDIAIPQPTALRDDG